MAQQGEVTIFEVAVKGGGLRRAIKAVLWAYTWSVCAEDLGYQPTAEEVAEWWNEPVRTAYREQAAFRACFPTLTDPGVLTSRPDAREAIRQGLQLARTIDRKTQGRRPSPDSAVVALGMLPAGPVTLG